MVQGADFLWMDNGVWIGDEARGVKILESQGRHEISVVMMTRDGEEYRGSATVQVLAPRPSTHRAQPEASAVRAAQPTEQVSPQLPKVAADSRREEPGRRSCDLSSLPQANKKPTIAIVDFDTPESLGATAGRGLADWTRGTVKMSDRYVLVNRENMVSILGEEDFAAVIRCEPGVCLANYGRKLRAEKMCHGRVSQVGKTLVLTLTVTDVSTSNIDAIERAATEEGVERLLDLVDGMTCRLLRDALARMQ
jgi:hypothetical protein